MSSTEGRKRLAPRMSRGSWRFAAFAAGVMMVSSALLALIKLVPSHEWDPVSFWLYTALFVGSVIQLLHLLRVRRNDAPFWDEDEDEDEARRADWTGADESCSGCAREKDGVVSEEGQARMDEPTLEPTPRSRLESAYDANVANFVALALVLPLIVGPLKDAYGYWAAFGIGVALGLVVTAILTLPVIPLKKRRVARDAEQGIFECAHRERGSALKGRWARGYAKAEPGRLLFHSKTGLTGPLAGPLEIYAAPALVGEPVKALVRLPKRKGRDHGNRQGRRRAGSIDLLIDRCLGGITEENGGA